jgi:hypothetical protein
MNIVQLAQLLISALQAVNANAPQLLASLQSIQGNPAIQTIEADVKAAFELAEAAIKKI